MKSILYTFLFLCSLNLYAQADYVTRFKGGAIVFPENKAQLDLRVNEENTFNGRTYWFIQFYEVPSIKIQEELSRLNLKLLEYIPEKTYLLSLPVDFDRSLFANFAIRSLHPINKDFKLSPAISELVDLSTKTKIAKAEIVLHTYNDIPSELITGKLRSLDIGIIKQYPGHPFIHCIVAVNKIKDLAAQPFVSYIDKPTPKGVKEDRKARALHRTSTIDNDFAAGLHYDGTGVNVCVRDDGRIGPHVDYKARLDQSLTYSDQDFSTHGDQVAGILFGGGNLDPDVKGTAKGAFLYLLDYEADFLDETMTLHKDKNVVITSSSYSDGCNDGYTDYTYTVDKQIYENPTLMHVFSAGNNGNNDCGYGAGPDWGNITGGHKMGKNSIAVGNIDELGALENTSSRGPASDGRIKPDICAMGTSQLSTYPDNTINTFGGTSAAAPGVSGVLAQLNEVYRDKNNGQFAPSALLKAIILNTANDLVTPGPDFFTGWGYVNAGRAYSVLEKKQYWINSISQAETSSNTIDVPQGTKRVNVMLYWAEQPAAVMSSKALINDLDLTVTNATGTKFLPWILSSAPVSDSLSKPATKGTDHLNNMEQVSIDLPATGKYNININGYSLPFGKQDFWVVYEIISDTPRLVYPYGGESFNPKELLNIHWDAAGDEGKFALDYSLDGTNWTFIKNVDGNLRRVYWQTLATPTEKVWLRIGRNGKSSTMQLPYTILKQIDTVRIDRICPDFVELSWDSIPSAARYVIYRLGQKYMESIDTVSAVKATISMLNPGLENWFSVQPIWADGTPGKRSVAIKVQQLLNCKQAVDLAISPKGTLDVSGVYCEGSKIPLDVTVRNDGLNTVNFYTVKIVYSTGVEFSIDFIKPLAPGATIQHNLDSITATQSGDFDIKVYVIANGESAFFNDTLVFHFHLTVQDIAGTPLPVIRGFEDNTFPPLYWVVVDSAHDIAWDRIDCIGSDGNPTKAARMNNYSNPVIGATDDLLTEKFKLQNETKAFLVFDYAYAIYDFSTQDSLAIDVSDDCGASYPVRIFYDGGESLQTAGVHEEEFKPTSAKEWKRKVINLSAFLGQTINFRFRNISGYGNSICIDNVKVIKEIVPHAAIVEKDTIGCINNILEYYAQVADADNYQWSFGAGALPLSANGQGPHSVHYTTSGLKEVKLFVSSSSLIDSAKVEVNIEPDPDAKFGFSSAGKIVQFTSLASYPGWTHFWDFGDGNTSTEINPLHAYLSSVNVNVQHTVEGYCGINKFTQSIIFTAVSENKEIFRVYPNPAKNMLYIESNSAIDEFEIIDIKGRIMLSDIPASTRDHQYELDISSLAAGLYVLKLKSNNHTGYIKLSKIQ